jgi:hypothetical protein
MSSILGVAKSSKVQARCQSGRHDHHHSTSFACLGGLKIASLQEEQRAQKYE